MRGEITMTAILFVAGLLAGLLPDVTYAQTATAAPAVNSGDTAWMLVSTALVLFMTLPGLALFYGGLVRAKNVLSVLLHCFIIACVVSVVWLVAGYSLAFGDGGSLNDWIGGLDKAFLAGVGLDSVATGQTIPETLFFMYQMTFAIITPALIIGAFAERMRFGPMVIFTALWSLLVYAPVAHWVWGGGWLAQMGVRDFAGGIVVHLTCGASALVAAKLIGPRDGFPHVEPPHRPGMCFTGAAMLWVGWFGFNAGSALAANASAAMAMTVTHIAAVVAALTWTSIELVRYKKATLVGGVTGLVAGLASVTPTSGFIGPMGAVVIGVVAGVVCFSLVSFVKQRLKLDDSLDVFAIHGVGGILGTILVSYLATSAFGGLGEAPTLDAFGQLKVQLTALVAVGAWTVVLSTLILKGIAGVEALRVRRESEREGLDITQHGEKGYDYY
jgi:Amt family ammonium transporter